MEQLENRQLLSVGLDDNGWTTVTPSDDTRQVYVSSSTGDDANDGLSSQSPVKTITAGIKLLRDGMPDWLLLNRGDSWSGEGLGSWSKSGRSAEEPMLISAYGTGPRPLIMTGVYNGFYTQKGGVNNLDIIGIHLYADTRDPASPSYVGPDGGIGIRWLVGSTNLLIEDCAIDSYMTNISISADLGPISNVAIRRSIITDAYSTTGHSQGAIFAGINGLTIEGNVFDHNGWNEQIPEAEPTIFNHNIYINSDNENVVVKDNIIANASSHGLQARSGGQISGNVFINNPIGLDFGIVNGSPETPGGVGGFVKDNIFYGSRDINGLARGTAIGVGNIMPGGTTISGNIMIGDASSLSPAIQLAEGKYAGLPSGTVGINDLTIENNVVYNWASPLWVDTRMIPGGIGPFALNNLTVRNNDFQKSFGNNIVVLGGLFDPVQEHFSGNRYFATQPGAYPFSVNFEPLTDSAWKDLVEPTAVMSEINYNDPGRSIGSYNGSIDGEDTVAAFMREARQQSGSNWRPEYTSPTIRSYFREGFYMVGDLNLDHSVTISDFIDLLTNFNQAGEWSAGDFNGDGLVTVSDIIDLVSNWGTESPSEAAQVANFAESMSLPASTLASSAAITDSTLNSSDAVDPNLNSDQLSQTEFTETSSDNSSLKLLTGPNRKGIIRPVWFTYPRR